MKLQFSNWNPMTPKTFIQFQNTIEVALGSSTKIVLTIEVEESHSISKIAYSPPLKHPRDNSTVEQLCVSLKELKYWKI